MLRGVGVGVSVSVGLGVDVRVGVGKVLTLHAQSGRHWPPVSVTQRSSQRTLQQNGSDAHTQAAHAALAQLAVALTAQQSPGVGVGVGVGGGVAVGVGGMTPMTKR